MTLDLPPSPGSAHVARRFLADACEECGLPELRDDLLLAVSELVTNSVLHARTPIFVMLTVDANVVRVAVRDHDPRPPVVRPSRTDLIGDLDILTDQSAASHDDPDPRHPSMHHGEAGSVAAGRGLHLLDAVSDSWGVQTLDGDASGKEVWFEIALPPGWSDDAECRCRS